MVGIGALVSGVASALWSKLFPGHAHLWTTWKRNVSLSASGARWQYRECKICGFTQAENL